MLSLFKTFTDQLLGRGEAAITVPVMDGVLKPNRLLDQAQVVAHLPDLDDIASDGDTLYMTAGRSVYSLKGDSPQLLFEVTEPITALACRRGSLALAVSGRRVEIWSFTGSSWQMQKQCSATATAPLKAVNGLAFDTQGHVYITDGSQQYNTTQWSHDLMSLGHSGRVLRWTPDSGALETLVSGLQYAYGIAVLGQRVLFSESWKHRVRLLQQDKPWLAELPSYPSRLSPATGGGVWLSCFVSRTQLVEFVLREPAYRQRMMAEIDPRYWICPALSSGKDFLEPLQGAGVKQMGVLKPWAPPRSYGLVLRVSEQGRILSSMHSLVDGEHHGITGVAEHQGQLYLVSKGSGRLLRVALSSTSAQA